MTVKVTDQDVFAKYQQLKDSARNRKLEFNLTYTSVKNLLRAKRCHYTRVEFCPEKNGMRKTIDRVDPSKGYIIGNVVACTEAFNHTKASIEKMGKKGVRAYIKAVQKFADRLEG